MYLQREGYINFKGVHGVCYLQSGYVVCIVLSKGISSGKSKSIVVGGGGGVPPKKLLFYAGLAI